MKQQLGSLALVTLTTIGCFRSVSIDQPAPARPASGVVAAASEKTGEALDVPAAEPELVTKTLPRGDLALGTRGVVEKASCRLLFTGEALAWMSKELGARPGAATFARYCGLRPQPPASKPRTSTRTPPLMWETGASIAERSRVRRQAIAELEAEYARSHTRAALLVAGYLLAESGYEEAETIARAEACMWCEEPIPDEGVAVERTDFSAKLEHSKAAKALEDFVKLASVDDEVGRMASYFALRLSADMDQPRADLLRTLAARKAPALEFRAPFDWLAKAADAWDAKDVKSTFVTLRDAPRP